MQQRYPDSSELKEERLLTEGRILAEEGEYVRSFNLLGVCFMLHTNSARALAGMADAYATLGQAKSAANFYSDAIKKLPGDPSLDDNRRKQLAESWSAARSRIAAPQAPAGQR